MQTQLQSTNSNINLYSIIFIFLIIVLVVLSFTDIIDNKAQSYLENARNEAIRIYTLARTVNAAVSVLQTADIRMFIGIEVGQVLDPANDAIERLSSGLVWAIGSLMVQEILLEVVSGQTFKWLLFALAGTSILVLAPFGSQRLGSKAFRMVVVRVFVIAALLRFIAPIFAIGSMVASDVLLQGRINKSHSQLKELKVPSNKITGAVATDIQLKPDEEILLNEKKEKQMELKSLEEDLDLQLTKQTEVDSLIQKFPEQGGVLEGIKTKANENYTEITTSDWWPFKNDEDKLDVTPTDKVNSEQQEIGLPELEKKRKVLEADISNTEEMIEKLQKDIDCIQAKLNSEDCKRSIFDKVLATPEKLIEGVSEFHPIELISEFSSKLKKSYESMTNILVAMVIKNILFPITFLFAISKLVYPIVRFTCSFTVPLIDNRNQSDKSHRL